jgi:hypothetical protein
LKSIIRFALVAVALLAAPLTAAADPLSYDALKTMVTNMGYAPKEVGETTPKMEILVVTADFNVPLGVEITPSGRFVWITANLGESKMTGDLALQLLKRSQNWQPTQFWITSSNLLTIGLAVNNTDLKPDLLKFAFEKLAGDVGASSDIWQDS